MKQQRNHSGMTSHPGVNGSMSLSNLLTVKRYGLTREPLREKKHTFSLLFEILSFGD